MTRGRVFRPSSTCIPYGGICQLRQLPTPLQFTNGQWAFLVVPPSVIVGGVAVQQGGSDEPGRVRHWHMQMDEVGELVLGLGGVRGTVTSSGLAQWRYHGRLVARQLDDTHVVVRADFDVRDALLRQFPATFSVPTRFRKHMMVVADLEAGDVGAIEDAVVAAWELQRAAD